MAKSFLDGLKIHHIGISVPNLKELYTGEEIIEDLVQGVYIKFEGLGDTLLELLQPINNKSFIYEMTQKRNKLLHICYSVKDLESAMMDLEKNKFHIIRKPVSAVAFPDKQIAWYYHSVYGLIELLG